MKAITPKLLVTLFASTVFSSSLLAGDGIAIGIGLNAVDPKHYANWDGKLAACENDARDMLAIAKSQQFQTVELLTKKATRAAVKNAILDAASKLKSGDTLVVSYSGHGGQVPDLNGDESDGLDETWCLFDGQMVDDELAELWSHFAAGVRIAVYSDSCHSGTIIKNFGPKMKAAVQGVRFRYIPWDIQEKTLALPENKDLGKDLPSEKDSKAQTKAAVILISGCADDQLSQDGDKNGRFTEELLKVWNKGAFTGSYHEFQTKIRAGMPATQLPEFDVYGANDPAFEGEKPWTK